MAREKLQIVMQAVDKVTGPIGKIQKSMSRLKGSAVFASIGSAAAIASITSAMNKTAAAADNVAKTARAAGIAAQEFQGLKHASELAGVSGGVFDSSMSALTKRMGELKAGTGGLYSFLKRINPAYIEQFKNAKSASEGMALLAEISGKLPSQQQKAALASAAFSRSGLKMSLVLGQGAKALARMTKEGMAFSLSDDVLSASEEFNDSATRFDAAKNAITAKALLPLMQVITSIRNSVANWAAENTDLATTVFKIVGGAALLISTLVGLAVGVSAVSFAMNKLGLKIVFVAAKAAILKIVAIALAVKTAVWTAAQWLLNIALMANPIGLVVLAIAAVIGAIALLIVYWDEIVAAVKAAWAAIGGIFEKVASLFSGGDKKISVESKTARAQQEREATKNINRNSSVDINVKAPKGTTISNERPAGGVNLALGNA